MTLLEQWEKRRQEIDAARADGRRRNKWRT